MNSTETIREAREYTIEMSEECGGQESATFTVPAGTEAEQDAAALREARERLTSWVEDGEYGDEGAVVVAHFTLSDEESEWPSERVEVEIEPNHERLIRDAMGDEGCGIDPDDHEWEDGGTWGGSGTRLTTYDTCRECGLRRTWHLTGSQRNPGEHDRVEYAAPEQAPDETRDDEGDADVEY